MQQIGCGGSGKDRRGGEREGMRGDEKGPQDLQRAGEKATARGSLSMGTSRARGYAGEKKQEGEKDRVRTYGGTVRMGLVVLLMSRIEGTIGSEELRSVTMR